MIAKRYLGMGIYSFIQSPDNSPTNSLGLVGVNDDVGMCQLGQGVAYEKTSRKDFTLPLVGYHHWRRGICHTRRRVPSGRWREGGDCSF